MNVSRIILLGFSIISLSGCLKDAVPEVSSFSSISSPTFSGKSNFKVLITDINTPISLVGECSSLGPNLEMSVDNVTWGLLPGGSETNCSDNQFTLYLPMASVSPLNFVSLVYGTKTIYIRGVGDYGSTSAANIDFEYSATGPSVTFELASSTKTESSTTTHLVKVLLSDALANASSVGYYMTTGTANASDFNVESGTLNFAAGDVEKTITVTVNDDSIDEDAQQFTVTLDSGTMVGLSAGTRMVHTVQINDNDAAPTISFPGATLAASEMATDSVYGMNVVLSSQSEKQITFNVSSSLAGGATLASAGDFSLSTTTFTIPPMTSTVNVPFDIKADLVGESDEYFTLTMSIPFNATLLAPTATVVKINANDTPDVNLSVATSSTMENAASPSFVFNMTNAASTAVTVNYTVSGTANLTSDYTGLASGVATISAGQTSLTLTPTIVNDSLYEADETIVVTINSVSSNATFGGTISSQTHTIQNDDAVPEFNFAAASSSVSEATTSGVIAVNLSQPVGVATSVGYRIVVGGTAADSGVDYTFTDGVLNFAAGDLTKNISFTVVNDNTYEQNETLFVELYNASGGPVLGTTLNHTYTITENDAAPVITFNSGISNDSEATTPHLVNVVLSRAASQNVTVDYAVTAGTAIGGGTDYTLSSGTLTFFPGDVSKDISLAVVNDLISESDETVEITLSSPTIGTLGTPLVHTHTINDNDGSPVIKFANVTTSDAENTTPHLLTVTLSNPKSTPVTVDYAVTGGSATGAGTDYTLASGTLTFAALDVSEDISMAIVDDVLAEGNETVQVTLSAPSGATLHVTDYIDMHTITDNEAVPTVQYAAATTNAAENSTPHLVNVTLSGASSSQVTVNYSVTGGTALGSGTDYTLADGTLTFATGETSKDISISVVDDNIYEGAETILLNLSGVVGPANMGVQLTHTHTINDSDATPVVQYTAATSNAGEASATHLINVSLDHPSATQITINYGVTGGSATGAGTDYSLNSGTLTFVAGDVSEDISVSVIDDTIYENAETIISNLTSPVGATLGAQSTHTHTIDDSDSMPTVQFSATPTSGNENATPHIVNVSLSNPSAFPVSVNYASVNGTALSGSDYTSVSGTLNFAANDVSEDISVVITDDSTTEGSETFTFNLSAPTGATLGTPNSDTHTIIDNEGPPSVNFATSISNAAESVGTQNVVVQMSNIAATDVTFDYALSGTATNGVDYSLTSGTLTITAGQISKTIAIPIADDTETEGVGETIILTLSNVTGGGGATLGATNVHTFTIDPSDPLSLANSTLTVSVGTVASGSSVLLTFTKRNTANAIITIGGDAITLGFGGGTSTGNLSSITDVGDGTYTATFTGLVVGSARTITAQINAQPITSILPTVTVTPGPLDHFDVSGIADPVMAGASNSLTVTARDANNNLKTDYTGTVNFVSSDGIASLPSNYTFLIGDNGSKTFSNQVTLKTVGAHYVRALDGVSQGEQSNIDVTPGTLSSLTVAGVTDPIVAGALSGFTVTAYDAFGNIKTDYTGTVTFSSDDPQAVVPGSYTFLFGDSGSRVFSNAVQLKTTGSYYFRATDAAVQGQQSNIDVTPAALNNFAVSGITDPVTAGVQSNVTVTALDLYGNIKTDYSGTISFSSNDPLAVLPGNYTFIPGDSGAHIFTNGVEMRTMGAYYVRVNDSSFQGQQSNIDVDPGAIDHFDVSGISDPIFTGVSSNVLVQARDAFNNLKTDYTGTIHFSATGGSPTLPTDYSYLPGDVGVKSFANSVSFAAPGTFNVAVNDTVQTSKVGSQNGIVVNQAMFNFAVASSSIAENVSGGTLTVNLSSSVSVQNTVNYAIIGGGTATGSGTDYTLASGTLTFPALNTSQAIAFTLNNDLIFEGNETFIVQLSAPTGGAEIGPTDTHTVTITDNDSAPTVQFTQATSNASESVATHLLNVSLSNPTTQQVTVNYVVSGTSTATGSGTDYTLASGTLTFLPLDVSEDISIAVVNDVIYEQTPETIIVDLSGQVNATLSGNITHTHTLNETRAIPTVSFASASSSASEGVATHEIVLNLSGETNVQTVVGYSLTGTATSGTDYTAPSGSATVLANQTTATISITVTDDPNPEPGETIIVNQGSITGLVGSSWTGSATHTHTITDNDVVPFTWTGLGGNSNWSNTGNWSTGAVPTSADVAIFNSACGTNCAVTINVTLAAGTAPKGIDMQSTYTGTITQGAFAITVGTSHWNIAGGSFVGSSSAITLNGNISQTGGSFTTGVQTITAKGNWTRSGGTLITTGSTVNFNGASVSIIDIAGSNFANLTLANSAGIIVTGTANVSGTLTLNHAFQMINTGTINAQGNITVTAAGGGSGTILVNGTGAQNLSGTLGANLPNLTVNKSGGTLTMSGTIDVTGTYVWTAGALSSLGSTLRFTNTGSQSITPSNVNYGNVVFKNNGSATVNGTMIVDGYIDLDNPGLQVDTGAINVAGNINVLNSLGGSANIVANGNLAQALSGTSGAKLPNFEINKSGGTLTLSGTIEVAGNWTYTSGTMNAGTSTLRFVGSNSANVLPASTIFNHLEIMKSTSSLNITGTMTVGGNYSVNLGSQVNGGTIAVAGNVTLVNGGGGTSQILLNGTGTQVLTRSVGTWPTGNWTINKSSGIVQQASPINLGTADIIFSQAGTWDMNGFALTADILNGTAAAGTFYKKCATLTRTSISGTINEYQGTYGTTLSIADAPNVTEGANSQFVITLNQNNCAATTFNYSTTNGTATAPGDFTAASNVAVTIPANTTNFNLNFSTIDDGIQESNNRDYTITLSNVLPGVSVTDGVAIGRIDDNDTGIKTWTGATNASWGTGTNWNPTGPVVATDTIVFASGCAANCNVTIPAGTTIAGLQLQSGYSGTVTIGTSSSVTVNGNVQLGSTTGTLLLSSGTSNLSVNGSVMVSNGTLSVNSASAMMDITSAGDLNMSGGTINNIGIIQLRKNLNYTGGAFSGTGEYKLTGGIPSVFSGSFTLPKLTFDFIVSGKSLDLSAGTISVTNLFTLNCPTGAGSDSYTLINNGTINVAASITTNSAASKCGGGTALVRLNGSAVQSISSNGNHIFPSIEFANTSTVNVTGTLSVHKDITYTSGVVNWTTSNLTMYGDMNSNVSLGGLTPYNFTLAKANGFNVILASNLNVTNNVNFSGTPGLSYQLNGSKLGIGRDLTISGGSGGTASIEMNGTLDQTINRTAGTLPSGAFKVNKASGKILQATDLTLSGAGQDLDITSGKWMLGARILNINDQLKMAAGTHLFKECGGSVSDISGSINPGSYDLGTIHQGKDVSISISDATVGEAGDLNFTVTQAPANCIATNFKFSTAANGSAGYALDGTDYVSQSNVDANIAPASTTTSIVIDVTDDNLYEGAETMTVTLSQFNDNQFLTDIVGLGTINDNEAMPTLASVATNVYEGIGGMMKLTLSGPSALPVTFDWNTNTSNNATMGTDYNPSSASGVVIPAGQTEYQVYLNAADDGTSDPGEAYYFTITSATGANYSSTPMSVYILDDTTGMGSWFGHFRINQITNTQALAILDFKGDTNSNSNVDVRWCPGSNCDPTGYGSYSMTRMSDRFELNINPLSATSTYTIEVYPFDPDLYAFSGKKRLVFSTDGNWNPNLLDIANVDIITNTDTTIELEMTYPGSDSNWNGTATLYYCNDTDNLECDPLTGTTVAMTPNRPSEKFAITIPGLGAPNDHGDRIHLLIVANDPDGVWGSPQEGYLELGTGTGGGGGVKQIYRSVGPGQTAPVQVQNGSMNINYDGGNDRYIADFTSAISKNVGVGDVIQYCASPDYRVAFIKERLNDFQFVISDNKGENFTSYGGPMYCGSTWTIYRAYTSLNESAYGNENPSLHYSCRDFDTFPSGRNLVSNNEVWNIALYSGNDNNQAMFVNWLTDDTHYLRIFTPTLSSEVGVSQRHKGTMYDGGYVLTGTDQALVFDTGANHVKIDGLILKAVGGFWGSNVVSVQGASSTKKFYISNSLIAGYYTSGQYHSGFSDNGLMDSTSKVYFWNNIVTNIKGSNAAGYIAVNGLHYLYNNTFYDIEGNGINFSGLNMAGHAYLKNNIVSVTTMAAYTCVDGTHCDGSYNTANDGSGVVINGPFNSYFDPNNVLLNNPAGGDYRLSFYSTLSPGMDLSSDADLSFTKDISGKIRTNPWTRGASTNEEPEGNVLFRSVAAQSTQLANDGGGLRPIAISGYITEFPTSSLPSNVGVGDVIVYDCNWTYSIDSNDCIAFIHRRLSNNSDRYGVKSANGAIPAAYSGNYWTIYRAYTSLNNVNSGTENPGLNFLNPGVRDFDNGSFKNLVSNNNQRYYPVYGATNGVGDGIDDGGGATLSGWTTGPDHYVYIYAPKESYEVGVSQRHNGVFDPRLYWISCFECNVLTLQSSGIGIQGIQIDLLESVSNASNNAAIKIDNYASNGGFMITGNLIRQSVTPQADYNDGLQVVGSYSSYIEFYNNIIYGFYYGAENVSAASELYAANNTIANGLYGFYASGCVQSVNNLFYNISSNAFSGGPYTCGAGAYMTQRNASNNYNLSIGSNNLQGVTFSFINSANDDFRLMTFDAGAKNMGYDIASITPLSFNWDVSAYYRQTPIDIGAHETLSGGTSNSSLIQELQLAKWNNEVFSYNIIKQGDNNFTAQYDVYWCNLTANFNCDPMNMDYGGHSLPNFGQSNLVNVNPSYGDLIKVIVVVKDDDGVSAPVWRGVVNLQ